MEGEVEGESDFALSRAWKGISIQHLHHGGELHKQHSRLIQARSGGGERGRRMHHGPGRQVPA